MKEEHTYGIHYEFLYHVSWKGFVQRLNRELCRVVSRDIMYDVRVLSFDDPSRSLFAVKHEARRDRITKHISTSYTAR